MEYINLAVTIMGRWMIAGLVVLYICNTFAFLCGVLADGLDSVTLREFLECISKSPNAIFSVWREDAKKTIIQAIGWPKIIYVYAVFLYDVHKKIS